MQRSPRGRARPDPALSVAVHHHLLGRDQTAVLGQLGFGDADVKRALEIATAPIAEQEAQARRVGDMLASLRAPGLVVEDVAVRTRLADESRNERSQRHEHAGWFDGVLARPSRALATAADNEAYARGRAAFEAALAASGSTRAVSS